jgi:Tfp pilus assembly protein PilV
MTRKLIFVFMIGVGVLAAALVFDGVSRRHAANSNQAIAQNSAAVVVQPANSSTDANAQADPNQPDNAQPTDGTQQTADGQKAQSADDQGQAADTDATADASQSEDAAEPDDAAPADAAQPILVPAGTTLTVRLGEDLGSRISEVGQRFSATLDSDIVIGGQTVIPAGAVVRGKVVAAKPVGPLAGEANLQLKLTSVNVNNTYLTVVSSTRSFGPQIKGKNKVGKFMKGLVKRASGNEREVLLAEQSAYSFTLRHGLEIQ